MIVAGPVSLAFVLLQTYHSSAHVASFPYRWLFISTVWSIVQVALGLLLGSVHQLWLGPVITIEATMFLLGLLLCKTTKAPTGSAISPSAISPSATSPSLLQHRQPLKPSEWLIFISILVVGAILLIRVATQPITNYDSLWFHLPAVARWYQTGSLTLLDPAGYWIFSHPSANQYPYDWHILSVLCLLPFQEDFLVALPMLLAWTMLGLAVYLLCIRVGAARFYSLAATSLVLSVPMLLNHVTTLHIDLPLAAFFTVALCFALTYNETREPLDLSMFGVSLGMLAGIKTPGIIYGAFLVIIMIALELRYRKHQHLPNQSKLNPLKTIAPKRQVIILYLGLIFLLWLGAFWYVHHALEIASLTAKSQLVEESSAGVDSAVAKADAVKSYLVRFDLDALWSKLLYFQRFTLTYQFDFFNLSDWKTYVIHIVARLQLPFLALVLQVIWLPIAWLKGDDDNRKTLFCLVFLLLSTTFLYWNTPYSAAGSDVGEFSPLVGFNLRYGFPVLGILGMGAAVTATVLQISPRAVLGITLLSSFSGIIGSIAFEAIRKGAFVAEKAIWPSQIISTFGRDPVTAIAQAWQLLTDNLAGMSVYALVYMGLLVLIFTVVGARLYPNQVASVVDGCVLKRRKLSSRLCLYLFGIGICVVLLVWGSWVMRQSRDGLRDELYQGIYRYIEENVQPDERIAYFSSNRSYLFYGKHLNRQVLNIPFDRERPSDWLAYLYRQNIQWVATGPRVPQKEYEVLVQLNRQRQVFIPVFGKDATKAPVIYKLMP
ncbi:MAG: hypothetical protein HC800_04530 [Phormidesmis sp. RL_2_1]|nr:hypothetical protein [Phormidesmis sp. RL_2_1]